jgi:DNA-binding response OmpR family regulator
MARFLVIDDDHPTVVAMTRLLSDDGHTVSPFTAGAEAVEALSRESFDAVVTDLEMPHVDGREVVRVTRERVPEACVVVATARAGENERTLLDAGACIVTDKPLDYEAVTKAITECRARGGPAVHGRCHMRPETR